MVSQSDPSIHLFLLVRVILSASWAEDTGGLGLRCKLLTCSVSCYTFPSVQGRNCEGSHECHQDTVD
jgi:hypothetical protein